MANEKLNPRIINSDLIGFSNSRSPSITDYFNVEQRQQQLNEQHNVEQQLTRTRTQSILDIDENACHAFLVEHASSSDSDENTNIFLQAPVLHLNIDKSLNQASSIVINKHIDFTTLNASQTLNIGNNNGLINFPKTNAISTTSAVAETKPIRNMIYDKVLRSSSQQSRLLANTESESSSLSSDSNSCDSGVVIDQTLELSPSKRRKPTTPHRILCPSPVKHHVVVPIKSPSSALSNLNIGSKRNSKTKRR